MFYACSGIYIFIHVNEYNGEGSVVQCSVLYCISLSWSYEKTPECPLDPKLSGLQILTQRKLPTLF
jgi:hypothetical protein